ncbi:MAG: HAMP domain-containing protein [Acidimicrobiales bacterium]
MSTAGWRVPINVKLLAILAVPVVGYLVLASTAVLQAKQAADQISDQASLLRMAVGPTSLTTSVIDESTITSLEAAELQDDLTLRVGSSAEARRATDEQLAALQTLTADNSEAGETFGTAVDDMAGALDDLRADVDAGREDQAALSNGYDELVNQLMDANAVAVDRIDDAELWQGAMLSELATRQKDARAVLIDSLISVSLNANSTISPEQTAEIGRALGAYETRDAAIRELATGPYARARGALIEALDAADLAALARNTLDSGQLDSAELFDVASYKGGFVYDVPSGDYIHDYFRASIVEILDQDASQRTASAARAVRTNILAGVIGLVVTAGITWLVSRSITRPLQSLTQQAMDTATYRLPGTVQNIQQAPLGENVAWPEMEPITVQTNDEVADVAHAFNTMQQSALNLAVEEVLLRRLVTDSLVTLGQRNQDLLGRQLDFITDLERDEADPETLADLFHLDHLAIRMRRNAESLLVLAGIDPPRTWLGPTPITDVIRAALGEAEEYKRVRVHDVEGATIAGFATAELTHLLAELIENALRFSSGGRPVVVNGRHLATGGGLALAVELPPPGLDEEPDADTGDDYEGPLDRSLMLGEELDVLGHGVGGPSEGYIITIEDSGIGLSEDEIEAANRRLTGEDTPTEAPSRYMGHYVAGKLAARHGITIRLQSNAPGDGITATIELPAAVLTTEMPAETHTDLPPVPRTRPRSVWTVPTEEMPSPDLKLLDLSAPVSLPGISKPSEPDDTPSDTPSHRAHRKPRKRKIRALPASKLPVPPSPTEPLVIPPADPDADPDQADEAS